MSFALAHYVAIAALAAAAGGLGGAVVSRSAALGRGGGALESAAVSCAFGLGGVAYEVFVLGLLGWINRPAGIAILALAGLAALAGRAAPRVPGGARRAPALGPAAAGGALAVLALAYLAPVWLAPLYPPTGWDATSYHLAVAKAYALDGRLEVTPYLRYPAGAQLQEMLFTLCLAVFDDVTAQLVQFLAVLLTAALLVAWGRRTGAPRAGLWAACLWLGSPTVLLFGSTAYVDAGLALYATLAAFAWARWRERRELEELPEGAAGEAGAWLVVAGVAAGLAAAAKYAGLVFMPALAIATAAGARRGRRGAALARILAPAVLCALPWYARNALLTGDPVHPFLGSLFGHSLWSASDLRAQLGDLAAHGTGRSAGAFLALWGNLAFHQRKFVGPEGMFSLAWVVPLPVLVLLAWRRPAERALGLVALAYVCGWFALAQSGRYLLPVLPVVCLLAGEELERALGWLARWWALRPPRPVAAAGALALAALLLLPGRLEMARQRARWGPLPVAPAERERFLAARYPTYPAYAFLNRRYGSAYAVYAYYDAYLAYFADGRFLGDVFGPARYALVTDRLGDGQALYGELAVLGATHFLVRAGPELPALPADEGFRQHFRLVFATPAVRLFELRLRAPDPGPGRAHP